MHCCRTPLCVSLLSRFIPAIWSAVCTSPAHCSSLCCFCRRCPVQQLVVSHDLHLNRGPFPFMDDDDLPDVAERQRDRRKRKRRRRDAEAKSASGKRPAAARSQHSRRQREDEAGPSGAARADSSSEEAAGALRTQPIVLSSDDDDEQPAAPARSAQKQRSRRASGHLGGANTENEAGPSSPAAQPESSSEAEAAGAAADVGATAGSTARKRRRLARAASHDDLQRTPPRQIRRGEMSAVAIPSDLVMATARKKRCTTLQSAQIETL